MKKCYEECSLYCTFKVDVILKCRHLKKDVNCSDDIEKLQCAKHLPCNRLLKCGHKLKTGVMKNTIHIADLLLVTIHTSRHIYLTGKLFYMSYDFVKLQEFFQNVDIQLKYDAKTTPIVKLFFQKNVAKIGSN